MLQDRVSNPGPLTYESGALPIALRGPVRICIRLYLYLRLIRLILYFSCLHRSPLSFVLLYVVRKVA